MRALLQVVDSGRVTVDDRDIASIGRGLCVYVGVEVGDTPAAAQRVAARIARLRVFPSEKGLFDRSVGDIGGDILLISNFTLAGRLDSGRRPSWSAASPPDDALPVFDALAEALRAAGVSVALGDFGAEMVVTTSNHGPTNLLVHDVPT